MNNLKQNDEGVSPVIGVILMVAITVVLAATVFLLVRNLSEDTGALGGHELLTVYEDGDSLVVTRATGDMLWSDLVVSGCENSNEPTAEVLAGDTLEECVDGATIIHRATNQLLYRKD